MINGGTSAPQLTLKAILLSIVLTVILASANAYVGLFAGLTVATAIPAAVISMAVLPLPALNCQLAEALGIVVETVAALVVKV